MEPAGPVTVSEGVAGWGETVPEPAPAGIASVRNVARRCLIREGLPVISRTAPNVVPE